MRTIKFIIILLFSVVITNNVEAQILKKLKKAAQRGVEQGVINTVERKLNKKSEEKTEEALDAVLEGRKKEGTPDSNFPNEDFTGSEDMEQPSILLEDGANEVAFTRGSKILYSDDFAPDAIGDFPAKWNTSQGGEVTKLNGFSEKWLKIPAGSTVSLEMTKPLPANFTIEYDLIMPANLNYRLAGFAIGTKPDKIDYSFAGSNSYGFLMYSQNDRNYDSWNFGTRKDGRNAWLKTEYEVPLNQKIHVAIEVNNHERIRSYINGVKMSDAPRDFKPDFAQAIYFHATTHGAKETKSSYFYVSNVVIAESGIDARSNVMKELLENGTFTTNDIHFASGSDKIEPNSENILNEIGEVMKSVSGTIFVIIGHTDSDGEEVDNQKLSDKRALAVKKFLVDNFGIESNTLLTSGKGETEPVADNSTSEGKAQNRRVEFRKM